MADKKKSGVTVMPIFVDGEQPSAYKFTTIGAQVLRSNYVIEKSVGDIWGESYPYSTLSNGTLSQPFLNYAASVIGVSIGRKLNISNIARLIGPAGNLNPLENNLTDTGSMYQKSITETLVASYVTKDYNEVQLRYRGTSHVFSDTTVFANQVGSPTSLTNAGDYYIQSNSKTVMTVSSISPGSTVSYTVTPASLYGMTSYMGSTSNVIPDENQIANPNGATLSITGPDNLGRYLIELPTITDQPINKKLNSSNLVSTEDINHGAQLVLPVALTYLCGGDYSGSQDGVPGTEIPEGVIYLKNTATEEIYEDALYLYNTRKSLYIANTTLDTSQKYCLITSGTNITSSILDLKHKLANHTHNGTFGESHIDVRSLENKFQPVSDSGIYIESDVGNNHFPQYLHRDGSRGSDTGLNDDNAMRGNLVIGLEGGTPGSYTGIGSTFKLLFGAAASLTSIHRSEPVPGGQNVLQINNTTDSLSDILVRSGGDTEIETGDEFKVTATGDITVYTGGDALYNATENNNFVSKGNIFKNGIASYSEDVLDPSNANVTLEEDDTVDTLDTNGHDFGTVSTASWSSPRVHYLSFEAKSKIVYAYEDIADFESDTPATSTANANLLGINLKVPLSSKARIYNISVSYSPGDGSYFDIQNEPGGMGLTTQQLADELLKRRHYHYFNNVADINLGGFDDGDKTAQFLTMRYHSSEDPNHGQSDLDLVWSLDVDGDPLQAAAYGGVMISPDNVTAISDFSLPNVPNASDLCISMDIKVLITYGYTA
jgi:hypothetical protein